MAAKPENLERIPHLKHIWSSCEQELGESQIEIVSKLAERLSGPGSGLVQYELGGGDWLLISTISGFKPVNNAECAYQARYPMLSFILSGLIPTLQGLLILRQSIKVSETDLTIRNQSLPRFHLVG